jgi:hypothetical protein
MNDMSEKMKKLTHEERTERMNMSLHWICSVIEEGKMDTKVVVIQELLDVLFDLLHHMED